MGTHDRGPSLARVVGMVGITAYAVGDILGAGIYALVGRVVGLAGGGSWASFLVAAAIAVLTGLSYAEMVSRYPVAAGASAYVLRAFGSPLASFVVGIFVLMSGLTSAATVARAFVGYLDVFVTVPAMAASVGLLVLMSALSYWGIRESTRVNFVMTAVELGGLLLVIGAGIYALVGLREIDVASLAPTGARGVLGGATVAFFAYIGFEDTVNVAEEVHDAARSVPRAILIAIALTSVVYIAVTVLALVTVPHAVLASSPAPLLTVLDAASVHLPRRAFAFIALISIANTGLLNLIMASRLGYGMARQGLLPRPLVRVHARRHTPWVAVLAALAIAAALASTSGAQLLAQTTSFLLVCVFFVVHVALVVIKRRAHEPAPAFSAPAWAPVIGALITFGMLFTYPAGVYLRALVVLAAAVVLYLTRARFHDRGADHASAART